MGNEAEGVHLIAIEKQVYFHKIAGPVAGQLIVQRGVSLGVGLQGVKKVVDDLVQGHLVMQLHQMGIQILHILEFAPAILTHGHDIAHILVGGDDIHLDIRLLRPLNNRGIWVVVGVIHCHHVAVGFIDMVDNGGQGRDQIQIEFPFQPLLNDLHMEHSQKAAAEAEAQRGRGFRLKAQGRIVELELFQRIPQIGVLGTVLRVDTAVDHGLHGAIARQRLRRRRFRVGDGIAHPRIADGLDGGGEIAHLAGFQRITGFQSQRQQVAAFHHLIGCAGGHHFDGLAGADRAFHNAHFGGDLRGVHGGQADDVLHLLLGLLGIGGREVDLVEHRQDLQIVLHGKVGIGQRLRLHALRGVHHQHSALAGSQRAGNLIVEVHMARRVNKIQLIDLSILRLVVQLHGAGLDGDAPFPLQIHVVQQLVFHLALGDRPALFQQPVRQGRLAVVNVGDDGKIADIALFRHTDKTSVGRSTRIPHGANFNWIAAYDAAVWN